MSVTDEAIGLETPRLRDLSAQSERDDTVVVDLVYRDQWVRFDISRMEAEFLTLAQLAERYLGRALSAVGIVRAPDPEPSSSETSVTQE